MDGWIHRQLIKFLSLVAVLGCCLVVLMFDGSVVVFGRSGRERGAAITGSCCCTPAAGCAVDRGGGEGELQDKEELEKKQEQPLRLPQS